MFYTYLWIREHDGLFPTGTPYYAGKGIGRRAFVKGSHRFEPPKDKEAIILQEWPCEEDAFVAEKLLILMYGRIDKGTGCLHNFTDGGEGTAGRPCLASTRAKIGNSHKGKPGHPNSPETIAKIRAALIGIKRSEETRDKIKANHRGMLGRHHTEKSREKSRESNTGQRRSPETCERISAAKRKKEIL